MTDFEKWKERYDKHWCTKEQLARLVTIGVLTQDDFDMITKPKAHAESWGAFGLLRKLIILVAILLLSPNVSYANKNKQPIIIAVIDTGVDTNHSKLKSHLVAGYNVTDKSTNVADIFGHGTNVAGVIVNTIEDYQVKIMPIKIMKNGKSSYTTNDMINGIEYAVKNGADIINLSMSSDDYSVRELFSIKNAYNLNNVIFVASSGNTYKMEYRYPSSLFGVISVGAINEHKRIAPFSTTNDMVDYVAKGVNVRTMSINNKFVNLSGTSFSTPYVSAVIAMIKTVNPDLTKEQVEEILKLTSEDLGVKGRDNFYGYGMINKDKAIELAKRINDESVADKSWIHN